MAVVRHMLSAGLLLSTLLTPGAHGARTPAVPVPSDRWGTLQPAGILGDSTRYEGHADPVRGNVREYHDADIENGYLFVATGQGMAIFNLLANPLPVTPVSYIYGYFDGSGAFPVWDHSDKDWFIKEIDAPAGFDGLVALGMEEQGFSVVNTQVKGAPVVAYQGLFDVSRVHAFTSGGKHYAYALERSGGRIHRFSLSAAAGMTRCVEAPPAVSCPGVYLGEVAGFGTGNRDFQGAGGFAVTTRLGAAGATRIYSFADPGAPALRLEIPGGAFAGVVWQQGSGRYLARLTASGQVVIHDVSCLNGPACTGAPVLATLTPATRQEQLSLSVDGGRPYLYVGNDDLRTCAPQREYLYDLTHPAAPVELTPQSHPDGYWGWYYMSCSTGFNLVGPRRGKVYNGILYRAAYSILDAHRIQTGPRPARVDGVSVSPPSPKVCQPVTFTASGISGTSPVATSWTLETGGAPVPGVVSSNGTLVWNTAASTPPGVYRATVVVANVHGTDSKSADVTVASLPSLPAAGAFAPAVDPFSGGAVSFHVNVAGATAWNWDFDGDGVFSEAEWTDDPEAGPNPTHTYSTPGLRQVRVKVRNCANLAGVASAPVGVNIVGGKIIVNGPDFGQPGQAIQLSGVGIDGCVPAADGWSWSAPGSGPLSGPPGGTVTASWSTLGEKTVTARNAACPGVAGSRKVRINPPLRACFSTSPPLKLATLPVSFDAACAVGSPTGVTWDFGDGTPLGSGPQVSHTYAVPGSYSVTLSVIRAGSDCPPAPFCENSRSEVIEVGPIRPALEARFTASASCPTETGCEAATGQAVTFTDQSEGEPSSRVWDFGDGSTASGRTVSHAFAQPGSFTVKLTVGRDNTFASTTKAFQVTRTAVAVVVPWVARSRGATVQTSDLFVYNPGPAPMTVGLEFRRRGLPEENPPQVPRTIAPGATLFAADVLKTLFGRDESTSGFIVVTPTPGSPQPVVVSQQTSGSASAVFGLAVPGVDRAPAGSSSQLFGLHDTSSRTAFFGITNPTDAPATYRLRFFDSAGRALGTQGSDLVVARFGQRQFQLADIRRLGISNQEDYRVAVESSSDLLLPYGVGQWSSTGDPGLSGKAPGGRGRAWLIGVSNKPGADGKVWKTDLVLTNVTSGPLAVNLSFTPLGAAGASTAPSRVALAPGATQRIPDVLKTLWSLSSVGVLALDSDPAGGALPGILAESFRSPLAGKRFGHSMAVLSEEDAAGEGQIHALAGLRQGGGSNTTIWVLNPGAVPGDYDAIYRDLDGVELGRIAIRLAPGKVRQLAPAQHPLPEAAAASAFAVEIRVRAGKILAAAQTVGTTTGDSVYLPGVTP